MRRPARTAREQLSDALRTLHARGQHIDIAFSGDEPLRVELSDQRSVAELRKVGVEVHDLPYKSQYAETNEGAESSSCVA